MTKTPRSAARKRPPARRWAWALPLLSMTACTPAGLLTSLDRLSSAGDARRAASGIAYGRDARQKLDVWVPRAGASARRPVVVFLYGGGWVDGARGDYGFAGAAFASQGFITVVPDYRLVPQVRFPAFVQDGAQAVRWVHDHIADYGGDPNRILLAGHSAGGYNAAMLALDPHFLRDVGVDPKVIRAAALLAAPTDFYPFTEVRGRDALGQWPRPAETQPIDVATAQAPPIFLAAGSADRVVQPRNSKVLAARLRALGVPVELKIYPGKSHVDVVKALSRPFRGTAPVLADSAAFLHQYSR